MRSAYFASDSTLLSSSEDKKIEIIPISEIGNNDKRKSLVRHRLRTDETFWIQKVHKRGQPSTHSQTIWPYMPNVLYIIFSSNFFFFSAANKFKTLNAMKNVTSKMKWHNTQHLLNRTPSYRKGLVAFEPFCSATEQMITTSESYILYKKKQNKKKAIIALHFENSDEYMRNTDALNLKKKDANLLQKFEQLM